MPNIKIAAFGALNQDSYDMFDECLKSNGIDYTLSIASPYPNAEAVSTPGRPLRGEALTNPALKEELLLAVANDAVALGNDFDVYCMPCMSMIGFHDGIEAKLGKPVTRLATALKEFYKDVPRLGVIHMRPAAKRVVEIFGDKTVTPSEEQASLLLSAEEEAKTSGSSLPVETVMAEITKSFKKQGLSHVLYARADAPMAQKGLTTQVENIGINSYFDVLADYISRNHNPT